MSNKRTCLTCGHDVVCDHQKRGHATCEHWTPKARRVAYLCDELACKKCNPDFCQHTTDIEHAANFEDVGSGTYMEKSRPAGMWIHDGPNFPGGVDWWHCSECGKLASGVQVLYDYCPYCGAPMIKEGQA